MNICFRTIIPLSFSFSRTIKVSRSCSSIVLLEQLIATLNMNTINESNFSELENRAVQLFQRVKDIKLELCKLQLELRSLVSNKEYAELKQIFKYKNFENEFDTDSNISKPLSRPKKRKVKSENIDKSSEDFLSHKRKKSKSDGEEESTTDSPYFQYDSKQGWKKESIDLSQGSFVKQGDFVVVYTDGACENNGKAKAKAGIGIWFGDGHPLNVSRPVVGKPTNNTAEIQACYVALQILYDQGIRKVRIKTDSQFTINCITQWIKKWKTNSWKTANGDDVKNKEELVKLDNIRNKMEIVDWVHIRGHQGERGNEEADKLAKSGAMLYRKEDQIEWN